MGDFLKDIQTTVAPPKAVEAPKEPVCVATVETEFVEVPLSLLIR